MAKKKSAKKKDAVRKIKITKVEKVEDAAVGGEPFHRVDLQLEVLGPVPAIVVPEQAVVIPPEDGVETGTEPEPQLAATGGWVKWLKSLW